MNSGKIPDNCLFFNFQQFLYMKGHKDIKVGEFNIEQYDRLFGDKKNLIRMFVTNNEEIISLRDWYFQKMFNNNEFIYKINGENTICLSNYMFCDYCHYPLNKKGGIIDDYYCYCQDSNKIMCKWCYEDNRKEQIKDRHAYFEYNLVSRPINTIDQEVKKSFQIRKLKGVAISCRCCDQCHKSLCENYYQKSFNNECCQDCYDSLDIDEKQKYVFCDYNKRDYYGFGCITAWMPYYTDKLKTVFIMINIDENSQNYNKLALAYRIEDEKYEIIQINSDKLPDGIFNKHSEIIRGLYEIGLVRSIDPQCLFSYFVHNQTLLYSNNFFSKAIINAKLPRKYSEIPYIYFQKYCEVVNENDLINYYKKIFNERYDLRISSINGLNTCFGGYRYLCVGCSKQVIFPNTKNRSEFLYYCRDCDHHICDRCSKKTLEEIKKQFLESEDQNFYNKMNIERFHDCFVKEKHNTVNAVDTINKFDPMKLPFSCYCNYCEENLYKFIAKNLRYNFFEQSPFYHCNIYDFDICMKCAEKEECKSIMENSDFTLIDGKEQNEFDYFGFGSIFDWIPVLNIIGYHVYLLLNCNPDSKYHGKFATFVDSEITVLEENFEDIQEKLYNGWKINSSYSSDYESDSLSDSESEVGL